MVSPLKIDPDEVSTLRRELKALSHDASYQSDAELASYLHIQRNIPAAASAVVDAAKWARENPVSIQDVAPFYRSPPPGTSSATAYLVCLEDMKGGVARDKQGRPIVVMKGLLYGTPHEAQQQFAYAMQRANLYRLPDAQGKAHEICFVVEVDSLVTGSFRVPDAPVFSLLDFIRRYFPESQFSSVHFCGLPGVCVSFFKLVKPFVSEDMWNRLKLKSSFQHLKADGFVDPSSLLPHWDEEGTFTFDLNAYVDWRAQEEGFSLQDICPRNQGRAYNAKDRKEVTTYDLLGTSESREQVLKYGSAVKQGSGVGLFASSRWKSKFLVLTRGSLVYFSSKKVSSSNAATRVIPINESTHVGRDFSDDVDTKEEVLRLGSAGREYIFGFTSEVEANEWMEAIQAECSAAAQRSVSSSSPTLVKKIAEGRFSLVSSTSSSSSSSSDEPAGISLPVAVTAGVRQYCTRVNVEVM